MMECDTIERIEKRKPLSERNVNEESCNSRITSIPKPTFEFYQSGNPYNQATTSGNVKENCSEGNKKANFTDFSKGKKEPRVNIHKLEKKKEENPSLIFEFEKDENRPPKRKKVENPENVASFDVDSEPLNDMQDTRMFWDESASFEFGDLSPSLTDLIFKPRPNKICRPPNAFMLFAKEHRRQVGMDHPDENNRQISIHLGNMWRDLSDDDKMKYYKEAQALEKLHKETYPSYVYSPNEARVRKQYKAERKQKLKETPPSSRSFFFPEDCTGSPKSSKDTQDKKSDSKCNKENKNTSENNSKDSRQLIPEKQIYPQMNPFYPPMFFPYPNRGFSTSNNRIPGRTMCSPQCSCSAIGFNKGSVKGQSYPALKGNPHCPPATYFNNPRPFLPFSNPMFPLSPRAFYPDNFQPTFWEPWQLWPGAFYCPPPMTDMEELQKNMSRLRGIHHRAKEKSNPVSSTSSKAEANSQLTQAPDSDDDDDFRPLVIDDFESHKENSK